MSVQVIPPPTDDGNTDAVTAYCGERRTTITRFIDWASDVTDEVEVTRIGWNGFDCTAIGVLVRDVLPRMQSTAALIVSQTVTDLSQRAGLARAWTQSDGARHHLEEAADRLASLEARLAGAPDNSRAEAYLYEYLPAEVGDCVHHLRRAVEKTLAARQIAFPEEEQRWH